LIAPDAAHLNLAHGAEAWVERTKSIISGELLVRDVKGSPALFLRLSTDRALYQRSRRLIWGACLLLAFLAVILGLGNLWFLHALILSRLRRASRLVAHITSADDLNVRIPITRLDELGRLAQAVNTMLDELQRSHNELLATHAAAEFDAMHDALTGLKNRRAILISAQMEVTRAAREHSKTAVLLADIDHFKKINDTYGHPVGDSVLISVATALESELRPYDSAGRYGGEEFLIVVPGVNYVRAMEVAERVRVKVEDSVRLDADGSGRVTISIGVAVTNGEQPLDHVIAAADMALYDAKSHGRNCVKIAEPRMHVEPELPDSVPQLVERSYSGA
jgi:diguanylate cyclase (GGDEF)-like protein